jgi:hypothetical protein
VVANGECRYTRAVAFSGFRYDIAVNINYLPGNRDMNSSVLSYLASRFVLQPENLATEALGYILSQSSAARSALMEFSREMGAECEAPDYFTTQSSNDDGSRPDIVGKDRESAPSYFLEAKFWAGLTANQPVSYLDALPSDKGFLLFVVPSRRVETVWPELVRRIDRANMLMTDESTRGLSGRSARIGGKTLALTSWSDVLQALRRAADDAGEKEVVADILQLSALCARMDAEAFIPLRGEELTSDLGRRVLQFCDLADEVTTVLEKSKKANLKGLRATGGKGWYGRYMRFGGRVVFLQYNSKEWMKRGRSPLWLDVWGPTGKACTVEADLLRKSDIVVYENTRRGSCSIPMYLQEGVERNEVVKSIVTQMEVVGQAIPVAKSTSDEPLLEPQFPIEDDADTDSP